MPVLGHLSKSSLYYWSVSKPYATLFHLWTVAHQASLSFSVSQSLFSLMSFESLMLSNDLILWPPPSTLPSPSVLNLSQHQGLSKELALCIRWPKYWSFSLSISPSNEYPAFISFSIDRSDFFVVQGTQDSSPEPQFESINSLEFSLHYGPILISVYDYWKNHSFPYTDLCQQSDVSAF